MSQRFRWVLAIVFGLGALLSCLAYGDTVKQEAEMDRQEAIERYGGELTSIVVAAKDLEPGDVVDALSCEVRDWVVDLVPEGAISTIDEVRGATLTSPVSQGTPLTQVALRNGSDALDIPAGKVALSVSVGDKTGVQASVRAGTVLEAYRVIDGQTRLVSQGVIVLSQGTQESDDQITLAVPVEDVEALIQATTDGSLRLVQPASDPSPTQGDGEAPTSVQDAQNAEQGSVEDQVPSNSESTGEVGDLAMGAGVSSDQAPEALSEGELGDGAHDAAPVPEALGEAAL